MINTFLTTQRISFVHFSAPRDLPLVFERIIFGYFQTGLGVVHQTINAISNN